MENKAEDKKPVVDKYTDYLYGVLKDNNAYDGDYNKFYNEFYQPGIKGYTYRKELYDTMTSHGIDLGASYEDFANWIGLHAIDPQTQQTPMGADSISKDMKPVEVTPTKKPEAKKEEKPEVSAEAVSENQHPTDTLQDFNPNVSRMRNAGTDYYLQAAEEISNNAYSKSLEELANQAAKDLKKKAYQKPKEDSYVRLNQTARYIPIRSLPKDADLDSVFKAALNFEQMCGGTKEYTFAPLGGDVQERFEKWKALNATADNNFTQETASMSPNAVYLQARNLQALGKERPAWISELRWNEASDPKNNIDYQEVAAKLVQEDQQRRLKRSDGAYPNNVSLNGMYHANYTASMASDIYNTGTINTLFVLFQDGRIRPLQAPDPSVLRGGWEAQRELFRRQYEKMTFGEEGKEGYTDPYEKNRVVGNFLQNGEVCHIIYFPYMIEQRRWDDAQELIKIGLGGKFNEEGVLLNPDDRLQIVPVVVKNGESEEDAIAKAKVELDNEISKKLPYKETYLQQQIAQAREALKKEQERLKQFGDHDYVKESYMAGAINPRSLAIKLMANTEEGAKISDEVALARGNIRKLEESIKKYTQALEALRTGDKVGFWGGFLEGISDLDNWTFGLYNLRENLVAVKAHEMGMGQEAKDRLGLARSLSQESMSAFHRHGEGRFYGPGFGTGYSTPFTLGAIATYGAGNVAARGIIRGGSRMAAKYGTNWLFDTTIRATTRLAAINAAGVIDSSFQMPRIISDAAIEKMGLMNYTFDENQRIVVTGTQQEKSWGHSLLHAGLNTLKENVSERVGTYVLKPVAKAFGIGKISLRSFGEALPYGKTIHMIQNGAFTKAMSKVYGTFEKGGYDGFVNEVLEEYIANPMTATFDENYTFADIFDSRQNLDTALSVWASSILMLGLSSTASSVKYYRTLRSVNNAYDKAEANARRLFGNENWDKIQNTILRLEGEPLVNAIYAGVCQNKSLSDEQKKAFLNYVRAQKAQAVFNNAVSEKYSFSLTGEELNEMNAMTVRAYAEGRSMQTPQEYAQAQQAFADTREMAMSALGVTDDIDAYLDTLGETPAEQLKKGVEAAKEKGLDEKAANAALSAYLNAREQQKGALDGITSDESIRRQHADSVIRQITFENEADSEGGSGKIILVNVKGREKPVFLIRGRYENGSITGETVVVSEGNGVIEMIPASEVEGIVEESDAMTERQRKYDKIDAENKEQQRLINLNMDTPLAGQGGILIDEEGHRRQVGIKCVFNDEQGNPASVLVVDQNNNDYLIPIDVFREQRGRGRKFEAIEPYLDETDEEYHAAEGPMNEEYNLANKEQEGVSEEDAQGAAEGVTPQPATDATEKPTKPEVKYDYHVKMKDGSGNAVSGRVTNLSADGVEIEFDAPYNGKMVDRIPLEDFDNGVSEIADANGNVLWNETEAVGDTEVAPQVDATPTQVGQEDAEKSAIAQAEQEHKPTALERIPKDENGNPIYEQTDAETAFTGLTEEAGNVIEAEEIAKSMVEDKEKALEKAKKIKLPSGVSVAEKVKAAKVRTQAIAKAQEELDKWKAIAEVPAQQRAKVVEERIAKEKAEAEAKRKAEEEAKRANEEAESELNSTIENVLNTLYKKGKDYASKIFNMKFFDFAKTPDFMKHLGMTGSKFTIRYGVIARHFGKDGSHDFTQSEWEQIPHAIEHPFAITQLKNKEKGFRIYTALKTEKGEYVVVGVDVKNAGRDMEVNAIATMFGRRSNANLSENEEVIYKSKEITPEQEALLSRPNSDQYPAERELSTDKVTESAPSTQEHGPKNSTQSAIESASAEVETSPTEAQKKAGNYKMGHVKVGAFDVTIENPKGSERSGTDANGKKWSVKMNNTYGYIRGTEGVDGDHIDVFLAEDMDKWDGKYVFVVDQYNPDGTFDEHKVMLGFNSMEEARSAYLSNYEKGWENGRRIVVARIKTDDFQKWVDSSHRKTKPFAHYVIAGAAEVSDNEKKSSASKKGKPRVSQEDEVKRTVEHFPMETTEEAAAFDKRVPEMKDSELLAYMQEDGKGDINSAYHMNIYDEYDYRHTDEQTEAYNTYIQQLHDSNTTLEQAEEMLGNILGDVERFATDERSQLLGQSDALQDYITELERQKEDERAEAENSAENADANHVEEADVEENESAEPVEADKSKQYGEYQEVYDNFVSDVENRGMIPDLRAIKNKIRDTKRRLTVLKNGATTSIQSDEDLKHFEAAEKKLTDLLHVYEAMRDYTEARIKKAEAAAQRKPWSEKNAQERMDEASKNPLTEEEIQNAPTDEVNKANALDYLSGNHGLIQSISYLKVYEDVRNPNGSAASDSGTKDKTQLAGRSNSASEGRDTGGKSGGTAGRVDNGGSRENVSEQSDGGKSGERSTRDNAGEGSNTDIPTEEQPVGRRDANSGKPRRGGTSGRTRSDGGRSGRGESGNPATENGTRRAASESVKDESADDFLNQALGEFKDVLDDFIKAGRGELSISLVGLNSKQMEILPRLIQVGAKVGYAYIRKGVHGFTEWANHVKEAIGKYLRDANLSDDEIDAFIKEMWKSKIPFDGQIHTLEEWASIYSKKDLRNKVRTTIEEKREAQRQAESISVKTGDINNIRETLPFLLPQQQEDVLRAETQFFDETHQDREHANGKGYMFTNGTGTGKTYTGLGIVKRFVKQGKKRILILTPSQPKVRDWINDGKNLGLEIKSLDDWAKERGTTATTEAGEGTIITTYANFRQNEELLNGTFDLIVYDESHRLMENKNAANTIGTNQHHMIANRDAAFATIRLRKINPFYQERDKVNDEFKEKREQLVKELTQENPNEMDGSLVSKGLIPHSTDAFNWHEEDTERFPEFAQLHNRFQELTETIIKEVDPQIEEQAKKDAAHTKVVFLSATPFNTRENIDYAQGYIFSYPDKEQARGYSVASPMTIFFEEHFGAAYKWRYGRLEHSERNAEAIAQQEREFSDWLQHTLCTMSGRIIDSEYDYSRDFPVVSVEHAEEINNAAEEILRDKYFNMAYHKVFGNYNYAGALFETLKVATLIPRIKQHLKAGRKVVIFHRRVESKTPLIPPFAAMLSACHAIIDEMKMKNMPKEEIDAARHRLEELKEKWRGLLKWESMLDYSMPREQIAKAFGADNVLYFSGQESTKAKNQAVDSFNNDESGKNIIVIQEASGKEGISLHDTTGKHQRVLITLALPQSPITALQIEGRIYRIGNRSNAIFEYPLLGLNSEIILFGQKFNGQIGTTENLALGSQARNLRESFARSVEESGKDVPIEEQGFGGKEADAAERDETSPFDRAVLDYYGNQKLKGKRDSREGVDYYPTPEPLGFKMVEWGNLNDGETALEPSAGHGAIARYVPSANPLTAIEPSQNLFAKLQLKAGGSGRKFVNTIFEGYKVVNKHDVIFMNPPFGTGGRLAVDHVAKAFTHLTEGGRIVAIIPRGSTDKKFDKWIDEQENAVVTGEIMLPDITFQQAGTSVMARVLVIDKVTNQSLRSEAESKYRRIDLSRRQYDKIEDFFEDIRDIQMPSRTIDEKARMLKRAAPALRDIKELKGVVDVQAQDDGIDIRTKGSAMGFYLDLTVSDFSLQQQLRTKYQRYAQEIEWNEHRHNEKAVEIYKAYNDLVCRLLGKTAEEVESDITREKMGLEQPHEEQGVAINVAPQAEESPSSEQNESTIESSPYHYELKHHTKTGAEMFMAMPNEKSGLSSEEYSSMLAKAKKYGGYWNRFMKGFAFPSEKSAKDFLAETGNTEQKPSRGNLYRQGEELSPNYEIRIVEGDENHGFKNYKEAKSWAKSNIARTYSNEETDGKGEIRISNAAIDKYLSQSAVDKSDSKDVHLAVLKILPDVIRESVNAEQHADYKKGEDGMRNKKNGINPDVTIHRLYGAVRMNGKLYRVKVTLKENNTSKEPKSPHSYEATKIELLAGTLGNSENSLSPSTNNSITAANLLKGVEKSYDAGRFFEGYSEKSAEKTRQEKTQAAQKATENLNLGGRVVVHESAEGLEGKEATAKGWYDTRTGQIHVVLSNNADAADVTQTILHEAVAHHGLRELFGHNVMDAFLDSVLAAASQEVKDAINELRRGKGWNFRTATEEYLAGLAERTDFVRMTAEERGLFATLRRLFNRALEFLGLKNRELSDRELAYILWCSYQNLKAGEKGRYVAEAERIAMRYKLKAGKNAMTDTEKKEHSVLLRGELDNLQEILAKDTYERLVTSGSHLERTAWVDMLSPLQDLQHAIEKNGGFKLGDFENPYNAYITMSSRNYAQMDIYKRTLYADMIEAIHALGSETGRSYEEIKTYVMAKHGMERQKYMAGKAAEEAYDRYKSMHPFGQKTLDYFIDEYEEKSFAGLTELFGTQSVSDAMDEAQKYVEEVEAEAGSLADSLWDSIRAATKSSLQRAYEAGLISKETYDNVSSMYQYYIPLRGFDEATSDEVYEYFGDQTINGGTGSFMKKAKGRKSVADDPFAVIGNMAEMAIMQSNRNLMKQQLLNLALNHPSDLISVSDLYVKFDEDYDNGDGTRGAWVPVAVPDTSGMTTEEANQVMLDFQDDMEEKVKAEPDTYALAHQKPHIPYRVLGRNMNEHQVMVKRGGKTYILTINGNPRAAQAINGLLNPDATENPGAIALKAMTNWIARMATARNVEFAISNAMRDLEFSTTLIPKEGTEYYGRYVKNYLTCVKNIGRLVNRLNGNTLDMSNPLEKAFYDFIYNGGETGYTFMKGVERYKGEITKALSELRAKEGKSKTERLGNKIVYGHHYIINDAWNIYMKGSEYLSRCTEDWVRFAVFLTSRQSGRSMEQSIMDAKEVTVNFNRKGAGSKSAGKWDVSNFFSMNNLHFLSAYAASAFKNFYAFSNASIQGLDKNVRLHLNHTAGMLMWDGAAVALGMLSAMCIPLMLSAIGGDPDDYWDMPESMRRMGIMLPLGKDGRFLTLPMSIEHRAAYGIGELLGTVVCGSENLPVSEISFQAFEQLSQILPLDLTEGNGSMLSLVPTAVRPEVEIAFNKNWLGMPIYKEPFNKNTPAFRNVYQSTNPNYIAMSKWLNEVQGGGDYERAGVQVNPAMVQHLVESYTGGAGKFVSRTSGVIAKIIQGEQIRSNEIPFYRTLVKSVDDRTHNRAARERFQREYDKGQKLIYKIDNYQKESARGNSQYVKELDEFAKSKDFMSYMLWKSYNSVKSQFDNAKSYIGDDKDKRAALDHAQMLVQKMMTECARAVEDSKTQEEADEKIGRIQSEYTPQIKETLSKVEE